MAPPKKFPPPVVSMTAEKESKSSLAEGLPGTAIGVVKTRGGWVVLRLDFEGREIVDAEALNEAPEDIPAMRERVKLAVVRHLFQVGGLH